MGSTGEAPYLHADHPEGAVTVGETYPHSMRDQVMLDCFDNEIKDGDSNAAYSFRFGDHQGEIFDDATNRDFWEIYPHDRDIEPVLFQHTDRSTDEIDFLRDAVLQTLGVKAS